MAVMPTANLVRKTETRNILRRKADIKLKGVPSAEAELRRLMPPSDESSILRVAVDRRDYIASRLAMAVEDCDAHLLNLNVTSGSDSSSRLLVELRVNHRNPHLIVRSLERYGFEVVDFAAGYSTDDSETARRRIDELIHYLEI